MKNMNFILNPDLCFGDYLTEAELEKLQHEVDCISVYMSD